MEQPEQISVQFDVNGVTYDIEVSPQSIFHDALHHHIPHALTAGHRVTLSTPAGDEVFPDMFIGETVRHFQTSRFIVTARPIEKASRPFRNVGFDHLAIAMADREDACRFFSDVLGMQIMRHDAHLTVLTTGPTSLFLFDADPTTPMSDGLTSRWHHLGFVVDDLDAAYAHLAAHADAAPGRLESDFILLERAERWSLYFHYRNGDTRLLIQLSEIKPSARGIDHPERFTSFMFDYGRDRYGVRFED